MFSWLLSWLWEIAWYALLAGGWLCWVVAHQRAEKLERQLTVLAQSWRYAARKEHV